METLTSRHLPCFSILSPLGFCRHEAELDYVITQPLPDDDDDLIE